MAFLTKAQILDADDLLREAVPVPEWGGEVMVRGLMGTERDAFEASIVRQNGKSSQVNLENLRSKLVARTIIDPETDERLFADSDVGPLGRKSAIALQRVFEVAQRLSGLTAGDVEELTKNSSSGQSGDSGTA